MQQGNNQNASEILKLIIYFMLSKLPVIEKYPELLFDFCTRGIVKLHFTNFKVLTSFLLCVCTQHKQK